MATVGMVPGINTYTKRERKTMMKSGFSKIATLLLALTLIVGAILGVSVVANAAEADATLGYANIQWGDEIKLAFTIENAGDNANLGIAMYASKDAKEPISVDFTAAEGEVAYYTTSGIAAKDIDTTYYVAVVEGTKADFKVIGERVEYSVLGYMESMEKAGASDAQKALYAKVRAYNAAADAVLEK